MRKIHVNEELIENQIMKHITYYFKKSCDALVQKDKMFQNICNNNARDNMLKVKLMKKSATMRMPINCGNYQSS